MHLDLLFLFVIILFSIVGYIQGFVKQILSILCWVAIFFFAMPLAHWLKESSGWGWFEDAPLLVDWGMGAILITVLFMITGAIIHYARKDSALESTDRWIGAGLGSFKGILASFILALIFQIVPERVRERFDEFHADSKDSLFVRGSSSLINSKAFGITEHLGQIRDELRKGEFLKTSGNPSHPWRIDVSADRE